MWPSTDRESSNDFKLLVPEMVSFLWPLIIYFKIHGELPATDRKNDYITYGSEARAIFADLITHRTFREAFSDLSDNDIATTKSHATSLPKKMVFDLCIITSIAAADSETKKVLEGDFCEFIKNEEVQSITNHILDIIANGGLNE